MARVGSKSSEQHENDDDDQDRADETDAAVTKAVAVSAEAATEATKQENDEDDDENGTERHALSPLAGPNGTWHLPFAIVALFLLDGDAAFADVDLDAGGLLPLLIELIAEDYGGDGEYADDEVKNVTIHGPTAPTFKVHLKPTNPHQWQHSL